eukprot:scaffold10157_cov142-Skeletonema_dohrnii-CCMP3373.AAC.35
MAWRAACFWFLVVVSFWIGPKGVRFRPLPASKRFPPRPNGTKKVGVAVRLLKDSYVHHFFFQRARTRIQPAFERVPGLLTNIKPTPYIVARIKYEEHLSTRAKKSTLERAG